jgi:hypothetical protein
LGEVKAAVAAVVVVLGLGLGEQQPRVAMAAVRSESISHASGCPAGRKE